MFPKQKDLLLDNENNSNGTVITRDTSLKRRSITTPSRRRRIIYDVTRFTAKCYLQDGLERYIVARNASTSIQSLVRRHIAQTRFHSLLQYLYEASTKIQRQFRSYLARRILYQVLKSKDAQKRNRAATTITSHYRKLRAINSVRCLKLEQEKHSEAHRLASRVQSFIRGAIARKRVEEMRLVQLHKECGAIVIQSFVRTIFARHTYIKSRYREKMEPRVTLLQRVFRRHLAALQHKKLLQSTVFVQNWWRHCLRYPRYTVRAEIEDIQSVSSSCPRSVTSYEDSETCSQEDQHLFPSTNKSEPDISISHILDAGHLSESGEYVDSVNPISNRDSDEITAEIQHDDQSIHLDLLKTKNAMIIQRFIRNYLQKARLILLHKVVKDSIDHAIEHIANQRWQQILYSCATKINAGARGYLSRKSTSSMKQSLYRNVIELFENQLSTNDWIPKEFRLKTFTSYSLEYESKDDHSKQRTLEDLQDDTDISKDPFLSEFLKHIPSSSMPIPGCNLHGIDLNDPNNLITMTVDFDEEIRN